jgi:hypothetical protein
VSISSSLSTGPRAFYHWIPPPDRALPFDPPPQTHSTEAFSKNHTHITAMPCRTFASAAGAVRTPSDMDWLIDNRCIPMQKRKQRGARGRLILQEGLRVPWCSSS